MLDPVLAAKDREIYQLRQQLERAQRAAGVVAAEKQRTWQCVAKALGVDAIMPDAPARCLEAVEKLRAECEAHRADVLRLEDLVESRGLSAAPPVRERQAFGIGDRVRFSWPGGGRTGVIDGYDAHTSLFHIHGDDGCGYTMKSSLILEVLPREGGAK